MFPATAEIFESWSNVGANAAQMTALGVGGWWAYTRFIRERDVWPRATLEQVIEHRKLSDQFSVLRVSLKVDNVSAVLLETSHVRTDVHQVLPLAAAVQRSLEDKTLVPEGQTEADWPVLDWRERNIPAEIEPEESDEFGFDFIVPGDATTVFVYSYVPNAAKEGLGWTVSSLYDLTESRGESRTLSERVGATRSR